MFLSCISVDGGVSLLVFVLCCVCGAVLYSVVFCVVVVLLLWLLLLFCWFVLCAVTRFLCFGVLAVLVCLCVFVCSPLFVMCS